MVGCLRVELPKQANDIEYNHAKFSRIFISLQKEHRLQNLTWSLILMSYDIPGGCENCCMGSKYVHVSHNGSGRHIPVSIHTG